MFPGSYRQKEKFGVLKLVFPDKISPRSSSKDKIESETRADRNIVQKAIYLAHWVALHTTIQFLCSLEIQNYSYKICTLMHTEALL